MDTKSPHPTDLHVGERVRDRRKKLKVSQITLAGAIGLTFQQVQKYERGLNRISASKLFDIAIFLQVPIQHFFEGLGPDVPAQRQFETIIIQTDGLNTHVSITPAVQLSHLPGAERAAA